MKVGLGKARTDLFGEIVPGVRRGRDSLVWFDLQGVRCREKGVGCSV